MNDKKLIDSAEIITMDEIKHLKLPYFEDWQLAILLRLAITSTKSWILMRNSCIMKKHRISSASAVSR